MTKIKPFLIITLLFFIIIAAAHYPFLRLPYFWDEVGQFVPAAMDIFEVNSWIPLSTLPNIHPPGLMGLLALVWKVTGGPTVLATRLTMLFLTAIGFTGAFALAVRLTQGAPGLPAFGAIAALLLSPIVFTQSMMAQLDLPAMVLTAWALYLFLEDRHEWAAAVSVVLVLVKETGVLVPLICGIWLIVKKRDVRDAAWYALPLMALSVWLMALWMSTGTIFGNREFADYNTTFAFHPVRMLAAIGKRIYYLFFAEFRWIGTAAIFWARRSFTGDAWKVTGIFAVVHILVVSIFGGAVLERYLLPVLPVVYAAMGMAWGRLPGMLKVAAPALACVGMLISLYLPPLLVGPFENNLAMVDVVELHQAAAEFVEQKMPQARVATAWPLSDAMRRPDLGYVTRDFDVIETHDFRSANILKLDPTRFDVLILYDRTQESHYAFLARDGLIQRFLRRFYDFEPQIRGPQIERAFRMYPAMRLSKRDQWVEVWLREK